MVKEKQREIEDLKEKLEKSMRYKREAGIREEEIRRYEVIMERIRGEFQVER